MYQLALLSGDYFIFLAILSWDAMNFLISGTEKLLSVIYMQIQIIIDTCLWSLSTIRCLYNLILIEYVCKYHGLLYELDSISTGICIF